MDKLSIFILIIYNILLTSSEIESAFNLEEFFRDSQCILEPSDDVLSQYIANREVQSESSTNTIKNVGNYRSDLNRLVQYHKLDFAYKVENEEGPVHERLFNISLRLGDETYYGSAKSKKDAKEMAARLALENTNYKKPPVKMNDIDLIDENNPPTVILNNLGLRHGYKIQYYMVDPMLSKRVINLNLLKQKSIFTNATFWKDTANLDEPPKSPFNVEVDVDGQSFYAKSHTIQSAKHDAASKAIEFLKQKGLDKSSVCTDKGSESECEAAKAKLKSPISILYEYAQKRKLILEFNELERSGPAHKLIFEMECVLGTARVSAKGKSKKDAKKRVAELMLEKIPDLDIPDDFNSVQSDSGTKKLKKRKKGSDSMLDNAAGVLGNIANFFGSDEDSMSKDSTKLDNDGNKKQKKGKNKNDGGWSPMEKLVDSGEALNLKMKSQTIPREKSGFYSLMSLDLNPTYICLGIGPNKEISQEYAALNALKFLFKLDVLEGVEEDDLKIERFSFDNYIWLTKEHTEEY